jgi:hypothetical protein
MTSGDAAVGDSAANTFFGLAAAGLFLATVGPVPVLAMVTLLELIV